MTCGLWLRHDYTTEAPPPYEINVPRYHPQALEVYLVHILSSESVMYLYVLRDALIIGYLPFQNEKSIV